MIHTEPYYSRKEDVPERPREFAGKVFRILHKDDLEVGSASSVQRLAPLSGSGSFRVCHHPFKLVVEHKQFAQTVTAFPRMDSV